MIIYILKKVPESLLGSGIFLRKLCVNNSWNRLQVSGFCRNLQQY